MECTEDTIWAVDKDNTIWFKEYSDVDEYLNRKFEVRPIPFENDLPVLVSNFYQLRDE